MVTTDVIEGTINQALWFHYDLGNDVLYLRLASHRDAETVSEETDQGFLLLTCADSGKPVGLTVVNWWKRFGRGTLPDSISELQKHIEPWADRLAA